MNQATLRFYEELNDHLPAQQRKRDIAVSWVGDRNAKQLIESIGVPAAEIDLILINGEPSPLEATVHDGDRISAYPMFERLDISSISPGTPKRQPRFILDLNLQKLGRTLRMLGFDTIYGLDRHAIVTLAVAEHRIILTRNPSLLKNEKVTHGILLHETKAEAQAREVVHRLQLESLVQPFARCLECNTPLASSALIPRDGVKSWAGEYRCCENCGKCY
ncbi:Mut7-C RNAse domain-containing protein [Oligoflexus tunisiensis]|uniref:Mut7-C RNAse domain-containing protein n=1 Tax=Oligoflexus tunisiensis TaxID=708132 RepID=UPI00114CCE6B|nr:Mut7-C RNAse domain-containing protein [Oligoflexus tunisiensis]